MRYIESFWQWMKPTLACMALSFLVGFFGALGVFSAAVYSGVTVGIAYQEPPNE